PDLLGNTLLQDSKDTIAVYNLATGVRFLKKARDVSNIDDVLLSTDKQRVLGALERMLIGGTKTAVILEYAEVIAPAGDPNFQSESDRAAVVTLHRWSFLPEIENSDNVVILISENLTDLAPKIVSNPNVAVVEIPMPEHQTRKPAAARASKLAQLTTGLNRDEITKLLAPGAQPDSVPASAAQQLKHDVDVLIARRKREILERECFGLIEFVQPEYGFEVVGGMDEVKKD